MPSKYHGYEDNGMAVLCSGYTYNPYDKLWYMFHEVLPYPPVPAVPADDIVITVKRDDLDDDYEESEIENVGPALSVTYAADGKELTVIMELFEEWDALLGMAQSLREGHCLYRWQMQEYTEENFHLWGAGENKVRFAVQNGQAASGYGRNRYNIDQNIPAWAFAIDVVIDRANLLHAFEKLISDIKEIVRPLLSPQKMEWLEAVEPLSRKNLYPCRWITTCFYYWIGESQVWSFERRRKNPPLAKHFSVQSDVAFYDELGLTLSDGVRTIRHTLPLWTGSIEGVCNWLNLIAINEFGGTIAMDNEVPCLVLSVNCPHEPEYDKGYVNFTALSNQDWIKDEQNSDTLQEKTKMIHVCIKKRELLAAFYHALLHWLDLMGGGIPDVHSEFPPTVPDFSPVAAYLEKE